MYNIVTLIKVIKHQLQIYIFNTQLIKQLTQYYFYYCSKPVNYIVILWLIHAWRKRYFTVATQLFYPVPKQCHTHLIRSFCVFLPYDCLPVCPVCPQSSLSVWILSRLSVYYIKISVDTAVKLSSLDFSIYPTPFCNESKNDLTFI